jgi:hypothetical protein
MDTLFHEGLITLQLKILINNIHYHTFVCAITRPYYFLLYIFILLSKKSFLICQLMCRRYHNERYNFSNKYSVILFGLKKWDVNVLIAVRIEKALILLLFKNYTNVYVVKKNTITILNVTEKIKEHLILNEWHLWYISSSYTLKNYRTQEYKRARGV